jgi:ADP-heptose:LPS heptosyltransferase
LLRSVLRLRERRFDLAFTAGWNCDLRSNFLLWLAGARRRVGYGYVGGDFLLTDVAQPDLEHPHVVERSLHLLEQIDIPVLRDDDCLRIPPEDEQYAAKLIAGHGIVSEDLLIGIHPGAGSPIREWGFERFAEVARKVIELFDAKVLWFSDPAKPSAVPVNLNVVPLALPFRQFKAVLPHCQLFVCNDSGPMHVAAGLKVPVVAIFGAQRPEWFGPWGEQHKVVIRNDIWCRPCADNCMWKEPYCLRLISVDQVMKAVNETIARLTDAKASVGATQ